MSRFSLVFLSIFFLLLGFFIGFFTSTKDQPFSHGYKEKHNGQKRLTNKLLDYDIPPSDELGTYKNDLQNVVNSYIYENKASKIAVYYRDLNNGPWVGVNDSEQFIPASLLKLPLMMVYFKLAETDPSILEKKYTFHAGESGVVTSMNYSKNTLEDGKVYTVTELINRMIIHSDNDALFILTTNVDVNEQKELFIKLGFPLPENVTYSQEFMSARNISSFFRVLYNATYLSEESSEKALKILTKSDFPYGIVAGVPKGIEVAQKYGERTIEEQTELHDCGIVYYPNHPYALCVMTEGSDFHNLSTIIKDISKLTYETVDKSNK
jgi:beta-lactamase class A